MRSILAALLLVLSSAVNAEAEVDPATGLIVAEGWQTVRAHCGGCHSHKLVTAQRGNRETWLAMIRWMQETQNLWQFDAATETTILDYLATHYSPSPVRRRAPIPPALMPASQ